MNKELIAGLLEKIVGAGNLLIDEPMKNHTSFKIGGPVDILITPDNTDKLIKALEFCKNEGVPYMTIGNGTNLLVRDKGIRGVVIKLFDKFNSCEVVGDVIYAEAGVLLSTLSNTAFKNELSGLEFAAGIPGTVGGAVAMNAGAYGGEMKDVVIKTQYIDENNELKVLENEQHKFGYRTSLIQKKNGVVIKTEFKLRFGNRDEIKELMNELNKKRKDKQPLDKPSAGSVFKRPEGYFAGKLIEDCRLRGHRIGDAAVSEKHCGFIVNMGCATASDVTNLIEHIQNTVADKFGVDLQTEVRIIGEK